MHNTARTGHNLLLKFEIRKFESLWGFCDFLEVLKEVSCCIHISAVVKLHSNLQTQLNFSWLE